MREAIIVLLILGGLWLLAPPKSPTERIEEMQAAPGDPRGLPPEALKIIAAQEAAFAEEQARKEITREEDSGQEYWNKGMVALQTERYEDAVVWFGEAVERGMEKALAPLAGVQWKTGRLPEAVNTIREAAVLYPDDPDVWLLMGEIMEAAYDLQAAVDAWEHLNTLRPSSQLDERIRRARADLRVRDRWRSQASRHFSVFFEGPVAPKVAREVLDALGDARQEVGGLLRHYPKKPIDAVLYTEETFFDVTRSPQWSGGIFDGRVRVPVQGADVNLDSLRRVATHEYVHAALAGMAGHRVPQWLHEGLAMNLETEEPPYTQARDQMMDEDAQPLTLEELSGSFMGMGEEQVRVAYAQSFAFVHSLLDRFGHYKLRDLVNGIADDDARLEEVFQRIYRETPERAMERALADMRTREEAGWRRS